MNNIERVTLPKVISMLNACKVQFAIIDSAGEKHGSLEVVARKKRKELTYPMGTLSGYFKPFIEKLKPEEAVEIPCKTFEAETLRGAIAAWASTNWGKGICTTIVDKQNNSVLVFRTDTKELPF